MLNIASLSRLAKKLINNKVLNESGREKMSRVVAIIGAGASNAADNLPMGDELAAILEKQICGNSPMMKLRLEESIKDLSKRHDISNKNNFRTIAFSLGKIERRKSIDIVQQNLKSELISDFSYEQLAFLFQNRFFDAVINFNFDEIFDRVLLTHFPKFKFSKVVSDNDCPKPLNCFRSDDAVINSQIYIKPHGTLSYENTLRFGREDNYRFQPKTFLLMKELFSKTPTTIVTFGFRLKFKEFTDMLSENLVEGSEIFLFDKDENIIDEALLKFYHGNFIKVTKDYSLKKNLLHLKEAVNVSVYEFAQI